MTELDISHLNLEDHECDHTHSAHQAINRPIKPTILPVFDQSNAQSTFARRLSVKDLPILSVISPIKLNAITQSINQSNDQSVDQAAKDLLKLFLQCQSERSLIYSVFESAFNQYIEVVQSSKQSNNHSIDEVSTVLIEQSLKDYSELCARISVLFKHCSMNIKSLINHLSSINQPANQSVNQSIEQLQKIQLLEQSKLALTIQRQDAISQFSHSKQSSNQTIIQDFNELISQLRMELAEVIVGINETLEEIREYVYED